MTDHQHPSGNADLPPELRDLFRESAQSDPATATRQADAIMTAVRELPAPRRWSMPPTLTRWRRRGILAPAGGMAVAFLLTMWVGVTSLTDVFNRSSTMVARAEFIGDTIIPRLAPSDELRVVIEKGALQRALRDTLYDTMRIVRFALRAPAASQVTLVESVSDVPVGEVVRDLASGIWELRAVVPRDAVSRAFAFVVDDVHRVPVRGERSGASFLYRETAPAEGSL